MMIDYVWHPNPNIFDLKVLYEENSWTNYLKNWPKTKSGIEQSETLIAVEKGNVLASIRGISDNETILYIQDLLVRPTYQHAGIGTAILSEYLRRFDTVGQVVLTSENSTNAINFYKKNGLVPMSTDYGTAFILDKR